MFVDGHTILVRVPNPPPDTFRLAITPTSQRVLFLRTYSDHGAIYVERDRRKADLPVEPDRRRSRRDS